MFRFTPTKLRNDQEANSIHISEFEFKGPGGKLIDRSTATATNPGGENPASELPADAIDGQVGTKWLDFKKAAFVVQWPDPQEVKFFRFRTANDCSERDPVRWRLEGSDDGVGWTSLHQQAADFATPTARDTTTAWFQLEASPGPLLDLSRPSVPHLGLF